MKLITMLLCVLMLAGVCSAIEVVGGSGVACFMQKGQTSTLGYIIRGSIPTLSNNDSSATLEMITDVQFIYSNFHYDELKEIEAKIVTAKGRKTLGFWNAYIDGGVSIWNFTVTGGADITKDGYYFGLGLSPLTGFNIDLGSYLIPETGKDDLFVPALSIGYLF